MWKERKFLSSKKSSNYTQLWFYILFIDYIFSQTILLTTLNTFITSLLLSFCWYPKHCCSKSEKIIKSNCAKQILKIYTTEKKYFYKKNALQLQKSKILCHEFVFWKFFLRSQSFSLILFIIVVWQPCWDFFAVFREKFPESPYGIKVFNVFQRI